MLVASSEKARDSSRDDTSILMRAGTGRRGPRRSRLRAATVYFCEVRNFITSRTVGMEGWAPLRVTEMAATAEA
jgi:hypothetical protein